MNDLNLKWFKIKNYIKCSKNILKFNLQLIFKIVLQTWTKNIN